MSECVERAMDASLCLGLQTCSKKEFLGSSQTSAFSLVHITPAGRCVVQ